MNVERPVEIELKYRVPDLARGERLLGADTLGPFRATGAAPSLQFEDQYVDTRDGALARAGFAARLRHTRSTLIVSLKSLGLGSGALHRRSELEGPATRSLVAAEWPASPARSLILELAGDAPLEERLTIRQLRRKRRLVSGVAIVELSLDEVDVLLRAEVVERFVELEAELVSGTEADLEPLRALLDGEQGLVPASMSKLQAAVEAISRRTGRPDPWLAPASAATVSAGSAATRVAGDHDRRGGSALDELDGLAADGADDGMLDDEIEAAGVEGEADAAGASLGEDAEDGWVADDAALDAELDAHLDAVGIGAGHAILRDADDAPEPEIMVAPGATAGAAADEAKPAPEPPMKSPGVTPEDPVSEAGRKVIRFHFQRLLAREAGARSGKDPEDVHAMRVATRRMRAAWRVFGEAYRPGERRRQLEQLRDIATRLGGVRDLDVLLLGLDAYREPLGPAERRALEPLAADWKRRRDTARVALMKELDSDGYRTFVEGLRAFVDTPGAGAARVEPTTPHRVRDTAGSRVWAAYEGVRAFEPILRWADVPTLHELRIRGKWLRYSLEFIREALGPETPLLIRRVVALQDHLGLMNDADVAVAAARGFLVGRAARLSEEESAAIGRYLMSREREVARTRSTVGTPWRAVGSPAFRRALGRALATL
jgi:CHAD domain-containing protein